MSRNVQILALAAVFLVTSREGRVSRNAIVCFSFLHANVTSREGRVSRNSKIL